MAQQPTQKDIDELMAALGGSYARDDVIKVARDLDMLPPEKPQTVLGDMVTHPLPPPPAPVSRDVFPDISKPSCAAQGQGSTPDSDDDVPFLEDAVEAADVLHPDSVDYRPMVGPAPANQSRWKRFTQGAKNFASGLGSYVQDAYHSVKAKLKKDREEVDAQDAAMPLWKKAAIGAATAATLGVIVYAAWPSKKAETPATDGKTAYATLSYNGTDWAIPKDAAKQVAEFMDGSFVKGDTPQTIESKLIAADLADKTKDNKIDAVGLKYLK